MTRREWLVLLATIVGSGVVILDGTVVNVALPHIARDLGASFAQLQWIVDGYLLSLSALLLIGGSLGDIMGRKRVYQIGLVGFAATSLLCALAGSVDQLIAFRIIQGVFGALLVPAGLAIINTNFAPGGRATAIGRWTAWTAIFIAIGPPLGGYIVDVASWRWIFLINLPLIVLCLALGWRSITESQEKHKRQIDYPGAVLAASMLGFLSYGLIEGPGRHWDSVAVGALVISALAFAGFIYTELHSRDPMVRLELFKNRNFSAANITTLAMYGALGGFIFSLVIHLQTSIGYSGLKAGTALLPVTAMMLLLAGRFGTLSGRYGPRVFMTVGPILAGLGMLSLAHLPAHASYVRNVLPGVLLFSLGLSMIVAPLTVTVMSSVQNVYSGIASGINNAVSRVAGLIVVAVLGVFGVANAYQFSMLLCAALAIIAGLVSYALIQNPSKPIAKH
jgi:EmrB/QacA subfamily drug resistance transporter